MRLATGGHSSSSDVSMRPTDLLSSRRVLSRPLGTNLILLPRLVKLELRYTPALITSRKRTVVL